jgi:hypothetical protein
MIQRSKMTQKPKNALVHGVYASDVILPWEKRQSFDDLLNGLRRDFQPNGTFEDDIVFDMALQFWKKRRTNRTLQVALLQSPFAAQIEESGKRSVEGIRNHLDIRRSKERRKDVSHTSPVSDLSEAMESLRVAVNGKGKASLGKQGAEIRSALDEVERRQSIIVEAIKVNDAEKLFDFGPCVDALAKDIELESRIRGQLQKDIQLLVMAKEFQRQYGAKHAPVKLIAHDQPSHKKGPKKALVRNVSKKKVEDENWENNENNNDNNNDNDAGARRAERRLAETRLAERLAKGIVYLGKKS